MAEPNATAAVAADTVADGVEDGCGGDVEESAQYRRKQNCLHYKCRQFFVMGLGEMCPFRVGEKGGIQPTACPIN